MIDDWALSEPLAERFRDGRGFVHRGTETALRRLSLVTPAESATNGATVSLGRPYPGLAMKTTSQRPASGGIVGGLWPEIEFSWMKSNFCRKRFLRVLKTRHSKIGPEPA